MPTTKQSKKTVYEIVTERILDALKSGVIPWEKPWVGGAPRNLVSKREYRGINAFILAALGETPYWLTFRQAKELGGSVRKGEHGVPVVYWKFGTREVEDGDGDTVEKSFVLVRYYTVFNLSQCDGIKPPKAEDEHEFKDIRKAEKVYADMPMKPPLFHKGGAAFYKPSEDSITLPPKRSFKSEEGYYATLFHEMTHSTGHTKRLNREEVMSPFFGSNPYAKEELVAEMGASFLCAITGIENKVTRTNATAYIQSWIQVLGKDPTFVISAASKAQKAADFILNRKAESKEAA